MSYRTLNIVTTYEDAADNAILDTIRATFPYIGAARFHSKFDGIIGQIDVNEITSAWYQGESHRYPFPSYDDMLDYVLGAMEEHLPTISKKFPHKKFAYIDADCWAGVCSYEGWIMQDGEELYRVEGFNEKGHIELLAQLVPGYSSYYFAPFERDFFVRN